MRKIQSKKSASILALLVLGAFTITFQLGVVGALAQQDTDNDGLIESGQIDLPSGMSLAAYPDRFLPICASGIPRDKCVDPATQDLFVIIQRATGVCPASSCGDLCGPILFGSSDIPMPSQYANTYNPLALVPGLGVTTHELLQTSGTQAIGGWWAVKVVENLDPCSSYMGLATFGKPYSGSVATVFPEKIMNWIDATCSRACFDLDGDGIAETCYTPATIPANSSFQCKNNTTGTSINMKATNPPPDLRPLYYALTQNIISHEASHMISLASGSGTSADHHWPIAYGYLMEQFIGTKVTKDRNNNIVVTLYISTGYTKQDKTQHLLK